MEISVCPASQLATVRFNNDSELRLFYQDQDKNARELRYSDATEQWTQSNFSLPALVGSSLATEEWANDDGSLREVMFFYQDSNCEVRSHFYIAADDQWNYGKTAGYKPQSPFLRDPLPKSTFKDLTSYAITRLLARSKYASPMRYSHSCPSPPRVRGRRIAHLYRRAFREDGGTIMAVGHRGVESN